MTVYWFAHLVSRKSDTYGAIGTALAMLVWAYVIGRVVIAATVLNVTLSRRKQHRATPPLELGLAEDSETAATAESSGAVQLHDGPG